MIENPGLPVGISLHDENQQRLPVSDVRTTALVRWALIWGAVGRP
jgi:hypothetical protein